MDDSYCLLPERISEQFSEIDSDIVMDLAAASPEYTELKAQMEELKRQNLVIGALLEGKGELSFTAEEHEALKEFIRLYMRADNMERELLSFYKYPLMQYVLTIILSLVWISLKGIFISVWYKVWYSSYKKCGTAPACKNK